MYYIESTKENYFSIVKANLIAEFYKTQERVDGSFYSEKTIFPIRVTAEKVWENRGDDLPVVVFKPTASKPLLALGSTLEDLKKLMNVEYDTRARWVFLVPRETVINNNMHLPVSALPEALEPPKTLTQKIISWIKGE